MNRTRKSLIAAVCALVAISTSAYAAGLWSTLPIVGGAAYCTGTVTGTGALSGATGQGQGTIGSICGLSQPGGPATFTGSEVFPLDLLAPGSQSLGPQTSALANITQLGQGALVDSVSTSAAQTIPAGVAFYVLDTGTPATVAITFPAAPIEGQIVHLDCGIAIGTALSVVANTGQTVKGAAPTTCTAGQGFAWRFVAGAQGVLVANTWVRIQ
jgi:hypothetical protein